MISLPMINSFHWLWIIDPDALYIPLCFHPEPGNLTPVRDSPAAPRLRSVNSYTNIRAATTARNVNKSLQNLNVSEEGRKGRTLGRRARKNEFLVDRVTTRRKI